MVLQNELSKKGEKIITKTLNMVRTKSLFSDYTYKNKPKTYLAKKSHSSFSQRCGWYFTMELEIMNILPQFLSNYAPTFLGKQLNTYRIFPPCMSMLLDFCSE